MSFKQKRWLVTGISAVFVVAVLIFRAFFFHTPLGMGALVLGFIGLFATNMLWSKCPHCNRQLGRLSLFASCCPFCGKPFDEE